MNFRELPTSERSQLVEDTWDSIADKMPRQLDLSSTDHAELHRRLVEHQTEPSSSIPWSEVRVSLFKARD